MLWPARENSRMELDAHLGMLNIGVQGAHTSYRFLKPITLGT